MYVRYKYDDRYFGRVIKNGSGFAVVYRLLPSRDTSMTRYQSMAEVLDLWKKTAVLNRRASV